jgi:hypothetical protein
MEAGAAVIRSRATSRTPLGGQEPVECCLIEAGRTRHEKFDPGSAASTIHSSRTRSSHLSVGIDVSVDCTVMQGVSS